ncbi:hypothetical protein D3C73_857370 [compost metagenome]
MLVGGEQGLRNWLDTFADFFFEGLAVEEKDQAYRDIEKLLRPKLFEQGEWVADYVRIRILAIAEE